MHEAVSDVGDVRDLGLAEFARRVVMVAAARREVDGVGCLLMDGGGALRFVSASDAPGRVLEVAEELCAEGPCHAAFASGDTVIHDVKEDQRWTRLAALLADSPIRTVIGVPVLLEGEPIGALNAFTAQQRAWGESELADLRVWADRLAKGLRTALDAGLDRDGDGLTAQVRAAVDNRATLARAAALIMDGTGLSPGSARLRLRQVAAVTGMSVVAVAQQVLDRGRLPAPVEAGDWVAAERRHREEMARLALTDPLTGLANRTLLLDRLQHALVRARRSAHRPVVLFVDLDRFKVINDAMGHEVGDQVLRTVANRLRETLRPEDTIARLGGDEFAIVCEAPGEKVMGATVAGRITDALGVPLTVRVPIRGGLREQQIVVHASIGVAVAEVSARPADVLRDADMAMYAAKRAGGRRVEVSTPRLRETGSRAMIIELALRAAVDETALGDGGLPSGVRLVYQPIVDLCSGDVVGVEALARWTHPDLGEVAPEEFVPIAEECGSIVPLGAAIVREACVDVAAWAEEFDVRHVGMVSVNVSARQLADPSFVDLIQDALRRSGLPPQALCLEVTESQLLEIASLAFSAMAQISNAGVSFALDDFGTGYSSLAYLTRLPVAQVKVDRTFVAGIIDHPQDRAIVQAVIGLGTALDLLIVAEGIETNQQEELLIDLGYRIGQGYLYGPPLPAEDIRQLLAGGSIHHGRR